MRIAIVDEDAHRYSALTLRLEIEHDCDVSLFRTSDDFEADLEDDSSPAFDIAVLDVMLAGTRGQGSNEGGLSLAKMLSDGETAGMRIVLYTATVSGDLWARATAVAADIGAPLVSKTSDLTEVISVIIRDR